MPWTAADASKHKKGLSKKQQAQWAKVANALLKRFQKEGDADAEGRAIRIANDRVGKKRTKP